MGLNIVLIEPEIPNNTGNIGRLALATNATLHLVKPFGFEISDKRLKRAGLDYWKHIDLIYYDNVEEFFTVNKGKSMAFFSSRATQTFWDIDFKKDHFIIFGKESVGLAKEIVENNLDHIYKIPLMSENIRSLNLANSVGIVAYEAMRQMTILK
ncbi:MAG: tRNA (cytidine/uridine-2'-O-)-methyltransferase [Psychromonas sp.]|jgi:tRNA (cytidine/uridine-2'-O-)-methyltransferase